MVASIHLSQEIFAIDVMAALWSILVNMFCDRYDYVEIRLNNYRTCLQLCSKRSFEASKYQLQIFNVKGHYLESSL